MIARAYTVAFEGVTARPVEVQCAVTAGIPVVDVLGPLTMLDVRGLVVQVDGAWRLAKG